MSHFRDPKQPVMKACPGYTELKAKGLHPDCEGAYKMWLTRRGGSGKSVNAVLGEQANTENE